MSPRRSRRSSPGMVPAPAPRGLRSLLVLGAGVLLGAGILLWEAGGRGEEERESTGRSQRQARSGGLSAPHIRKLISEVDLDRFWKSFLRPMLIERPPGSPGNSLVRNLIVDHLTSLGWTVDLDLFDAVTPRGSLPFGNVVATLDPSAPHRLVFACHLDSKWFPPEGGRPFIGATDSAVPCSLILEVVTALHKRLQGLKLKGSPLTLQLLFLDGEEAFGEWSATDSLYGSRHLASKMEKQKLPGGGGSLLKAIDLFVLLDLLGAQDPLILNHYPETTSHFKRLSSIEKQLHHMDLLESHAADNVYFRSNFFNTPVEDDHVPFVQRGVPALHVIATPFPAVWHTRDDTEVNLHRPTIANLCRIFVTFIGDALDL
ncbi:glutaminyl-peptide cyclotransferase-like protein [Discoglossus pictus]